MRNVMLCTRSSFSDVGGTNLCVLTTENGKKDDIFAIVWEFESQIWIFVPFWDRELDLYSFSSALTKYFILYSILGAPSFFCWVVLRLSLSQFILRCWQMYFPQIDLYQNRLYSPVLEHGPGSFSYARVKTFKRVEAQWKWQKLRFFRFILMVSVPCVHVPMSQSFNSNGKICDRVRMKRPERWWSILGQNEARRNPGGGSSRYWRANRSFDLSIGAKDLSNHRVAGSFRSFP